jgi:hypothetical protein
MKPDPQRDPGQGAAPGREPDPLAQELQRRADRIAAMIVASDYPDVDIEIQIRQLRRWVQVNLPERQDLFELVYGARFRRLREQFRMRPGP